MRKSNRANIWGATIATSAHHCHPAPCHTPETALKHDGATIAPMATSEGGGAVRTVMSVIAGAVLVLAVATGVATGSVRTAPSAETDRLVGSWDTGPIPVRKLRGALVAAGYDNAKVTAFFEQFGVVNAYEFKLEFYREAGVPFLAKNGWDPSTGSEPKDSDHGPYTLRPKRRFVSRGVDPPTDRYRVSFAYSIASKRLKLRLVSVSEPGLSKGDLFIDTMILRASAAFRYKRIG
jgi:hypothetical protein